MEAKFTFKFRLDGRREFEDGTYPIKVNVHNLATNTNRDYSFTDKYNKLNATKKILKVFGRIDLSITISMRF